MEKKLAEVLEREFPGSQPISVLEPDGGHAHRTFIVEFTDREPVFVKIDDLGDLEWDERFGVTDPATGLVDRRTGIPVPRTLGSGSLESGQGYLATEVLEGSCPANWSSGLKFQKMGEDQKKRLLRQLAGYLSKLHTINFDCCGELIAGNPLKVKDCRSWEKHFNELAGEWAHSLESSGYGGQASKMLEKLDKHSDILEFDGRPSLLHGEAGLRNLLVRSSGDITGLLDWEWLNAGDPLFDVVRAECRTIEVSFRTDERWEFYRKYFYRQYFGDSLPENWRMKRDLYLLHHFAWEISLVEDIYDYRVERMEKVLERL